MVYVVMRDGRVVVYNDGGAIEEEGASYAIRTRDEESLVARVPVALVERIEFRRPCNIYRRNKKLKGKY